MSLPFLFWKVFHLQIGQRLSHYCHKVQCRKKTCTIPKCFPRADWGTAAIIMRLNDKRSHSGLYLLPIKYLIGRVIAVRQPSARGYCGASCNDFLYFLIWWQTSDMMDGWPGAPGCAHAPARLWTYLPVHLLWGITASGALSRPQQATSTLTGARRGRGGGRGRRIL